MEKWKTQLLPGEPDFIRLAAELLQQGEVVGFHTETVYGLGANALDPEAVMKIFAAKGRPADNPLIVHITSMNMLDGLVRDVPQLAYRLAERFWPGPMTMILPKDEAVSDAVTAGLDTVGIRYPASPLAQALISAAGVPVAAPSGNRSGSPSPTTAEHMLADMDGRIPMILDGGECKVGLESTVILVKSDRVRLLRPGGVTVEMLEEICPVEIDKGVLNEIDSGEKVASPGMKYKHYAPSAEVSIVEGSLDSYIAFLRKQADDDTYAVVFAGEEDKMPVKALSFGHQDKPDEQAHLLFDLLRQCDELGAKKVYVRSPDRHGIGLAVYNRLIRAAAFRIIDADAKC